MGLFMSPVVLLVVQYWTMCSLLQHTIAIFVSLLDNGIVDVGIYLELFQSFGHARNTMVLLTFILWLDRLLFQAGYACSLCVELLNLVLSIGYKDLAGFLKTLIWKLFEGNSGAGLQSSSPSARS